MSLVDRSDMSAHPGDSAPPGLLAISRMARASRPVFIVGEARSGSTLLFRTLMQHPSFRPRTENLQETSFVMQAPRAAAFDAAQPRNLRRFLLEDEAEWASFLASIQVVRWWLKLAERLSPSTAWRWRLGPSRLVARSYAWHAQRARGCRRLLEKTPGHIQHIDRLLLGFPAARVLYIFRHPVDVYSSFVRRGRVDPKADWARISPAEFCCRYRRNTRLALTAARRRPDTVRLIRYEQFTTDPEAVIRRVCEFIGEPFLAEALPAADPDPESWAHWEQSRHLYDVPKRHTKDWRDFCSVDVADWIQGQLGPEMDMLGYVRYAADDQSRSASDSRASNQMPRRPA